jgi:hypothetical protein
MSTPVISGDGIFSHVFLGAADVQKSVAFYDAALGALGIKNLGPFGSGWVLYGRDKPAFIIARPGNGEAPTRASLARVVTCRVPMRPTCVIRQATRFARTPSSESKDAESLPKEPAQASIRLAH